MTTLTRFRVMCAALLLATLPGRPLGAQDREPARLRLETRLDARARGEIAEIIARAERIGLPAEPLIDKALEGASKGARPDRVVAAVRSLAERLGTARGVLGEGASEAELVAAAGALQVGVAAPTLARLRALREGQPSTVALIVLADLVARGVPADTAASLVVALAAGDAADQAFVDLRREVARDITAGAPPVVAASVRTRGALVAASPSPSAVIGDNVGERLTTTDAFAPPARTGTNTTAKPTPRKP